MASEKTIFLVDSRYPGVDAVGDALGAVIPIIFQRRQSDYLGGDYLLCKNEDWLVTVRKNHSSFLDEWYTGHDVGVPYVVIVERCRPGMFDAAATLPGFRRHEG